MELAIGFLAAVAIALTGVGGGVLVAPILILAMGLRPAEAVGTALAFVAVVKTLAVPVYLYRRQVDSTVLRSMLWGGVPGVLAGSFLLRRANQSGLNGVVLSVVGATVAVSAALSLIRTVWQPPRKAMARFRWMPALCGAIGLEVGFSSAGAGALGTLVLFRFTSLAPVVAVGTDLVFGWILSMIGAGAHAAAGALNTAVLVKLIAGGVAGTLAGTQLAGVVPARALRAVISLLLVSAGVELCARGLGRLAGG